MLCFQVDGPKELSFSRVTVLVAHICESQDLSNEPEGGLFPF